MTGRGDGPADGGGQRNVGMTGDGGVGEFDFYSKVGQTEDVVINSLNMEIINDADQNGVKQPDAGISDINNMVDSLRQGYSSMRDRQELPLIQLAKEDLEKKRATNNEGWKKFVNKVKDFGEKMAVVANLGEMALKDETIRGRVVQGATEKGKSAAENMKKKTSESWEGAKTTVKEYNDKLEKKLTSSIDKAFDNIANSAMEIATKTINTVSRELAVPFLEGIVIPAIEQADQARLTVAQVKVGIYEGLASPIESAVEWVLQNTDGPEAKWLRLTRRLSEYTDEKKGLLMRTCAWLGKNISETRKFSKKLRGEAAVLRIDAQKVKNRFNVESHGRGDQIDTARKVADQFKNGILQNN